MFYYRNLNHDAYSFALAGLSVGAGAGPYPIVSSDRFADSDTGAHTPEKPANPRRARFFGLGRRFAWGDSQ